MNRHLIALLGLVVLTAACSTAASNPPVLDGRQFLSVDVTVGGVQRQLVAGTRIRLSFNDGNVGANAGCNHMSGAFRIDGGRLFVDQMGMTEMGCDPARHDQDAWLSAFLASGPQLRLAGADLILEGDGTLIRLLDREVAEPDVELTGQRWTLTTIIDGGAASSIPDDIVATLEFTDEGNFSLHAGCNQGGGRYQIVDGTLVFSDIMLTRMACDGPRSQVEGAVLAVLEADAVEYAIDSNTLTLTAGNAGLAYTAVNAIDL